ncbi:hypothetical protein [Mycobacterium sherrisii]|uniref:hypothetical protein n=1 Tax=Mycobacterium sherrisii TaxID=243061 RepID=UPI000A1564F5|nr:hypothetical protein [Mycobacterium sherrisii]MCV7029442.1 hypothetical protein [Mycobacterium sherrisii]MEC4761583.1 hypothetical protein [Mycobacterium sherrisii]ORW77635.1 hypothetical protein AWC25_08035 [Mycobacterium sherrisii]
MFEAGEQLRVAVDVMTAWTTDPDNVDFAIGRAKGYLDEGPDGYQTLLAGFVGLSGWLLIRLAKAESGKATRDEMRTILQDIARRSI